MRFLNNRRGLVALLMVMSVSAWAEDAQARAAREEIDRQLRQMVGKQPTRVRIDFVGLDDLNYPLEEARFELDGRPLSSPSLSQLSAEGMHLVWNDEVNPGKHMVGVHLVFANGTSVVLSDEGGHKWKVTGEVSFELQSGIEVQVEVRPRRDPGQLDVAKRFKLALPARPVMVARLDDGKMPEPAPQPILTAVVAPEEPASAEPAPEVKRKRRGRMTDEELEAERLAKESRQQELADAREAKRAAQRERRQQAADAREAKRLAARERRDRTADGVIVAQEARDGLEPLPDEVPLAEVDAGMGEEEVVAAEEPYDAGVVLAEAQPVVAETPVDLERSSSEESPPWMLIGGAAALAALAFLLVVLWRRGAGR